MSALAHPDRGLETRIRRAAGVFVAPFRDPRWARTLATQGAWLLVPVVGWIALLGWQRSVFDRVRSRKGGLPDPALGSHLRRGLPVAGAITLLLAPCFALLAMGDAVSHGRGPRVLAILLDRDLLPFFAIPWLYFGYPETLRRAWLARNVPAFLDPRPSVSAIRKDPIGFLFAGISMMCAWLVVAAGINACVIGIVVSAPLGHAIAAGIVAVWHAETDHEMSEQPSM